jgi:hypothetical protein
MRFDIVPVGRTCLGTRHEVSRNVNSSQAAGMVQSSSRKPSCEVHRQKQTTKVQL